MTTFTLRLEPIAGSHFNTAKQEASDIAKKLNVGVEFRFNDRRYYIFPYTNIASITLEHGYKVR